MSFSPLELFLLLVAIIGPLNPTVILASAASSSGADPTAVRSVTLRTTLAAASILIGFIVLGEFALDMFFGYKPKKNPVSTGEDTITLPFCD